MKILIVGAGAVGGYFGGRLVEAGEDVTFLVRPERQAALRRDGLRIESALGNMHCAVHTAIREDLEPRYDVILLACKAYDLDSAIDGLAPAVRDDSAIVPLLNGLDHFSRLDERFGQPTVLGGTCQIFAKRDADGVIRHSGTLQRMIFGERNASASQRTRRLADTLARTRIDWMLSDDIEQDLWGKIVFLSALAATTCLFRGNLGEILAAPGARDVMDRALNANIEIARRERHPLTEHNIQFARRSFSDPASTASSSMLHDLEAGGRTECDHVIGWMLNKARTHGVDDAILSLAYIHLKTHEARLDKRGKQ